MAGKIRQWLEELDLGEYADAFEMNQLDLQHLVDLSENDLKELGVAAMGHRKTLLRAIAAMVDDDDDVHEATPLATAHPLAEAERRQITIMFVDMVGSTALSARLDPEEMREAITSYQNTVAGVVTRFDGHVAKYMGDGVLCYFGWPRAHEDDAERAARAGLAIMEAVGAMSAPNGEALAARAGIATGLVVVGDLIGEGAAQEEAVVGETPNLAARLQGVAAPGQVVLASATRHLLGDLFDLDDLGLQDLAGIAAPVLAFAVRGERLAETRFDARQTEGPAAMIGRDQELELLVDRWRQAEAGEGQMVLLTGEAGIGKSRITRAMRDVLANEDHIRIGYQCSAYHTDSALHPTIQQLTLAAGFDPHDSPEDRLDKLEALLRGARDDISIASPLLGGLLGLGDVAEARHGHLDYSPQQRRAQTLEVLLDQLTGLAAKTPVLFVVEDAHWIDPTTQEFLELILDSIGVAAVMVLVTARPTFKDGFGDHPNLMRLALSRLGVEQTRRIVTRITEGKSLPPELLDEITAKTDGVPLFVEELTKTVLESDALQATKDGWVLTGGLDRLEIPSSLQDSLMARLDRLQPVKEVAQCAACIGREFSYPLLEAASPLKKDKLTEALDQLAAAELVFCRGIPPEATYAFKHALVRDAAYNSLLKSSRQRHHQRIAQIIEENFPELVVSEPELLAHHLTEAGLTKPAIDYWLKAGQRAAQRSANVEAIAHFQRALDLILEQPDTPERDDVELNLRINLGPVLMAAKGYAAAEVDACYARARELAEMLGDTARLFTVLYGLWQSRNIGGRISEAKGIADELVRMTQGESNTGRQLQAHHANWTSGIMCGDPQGGWEHTREGLRLYDKNEHKDHKYLYGAHDPAVCALSFGGVASWMLGRYEESKQLEKKGLALADHLDHPTSKAVAHMFATANQYLAQDFARAIEIGDAGVALCEKAGLITWGQMTGLIQAFARAKADPKYPPSELGRRIEAYRTAGHGAFWSAFLCWAAEIHLNSGNLEYTADAIESAFANSSDSGESWFDAELHRLKGELILARSSADWALAATEFRKALKVAVAQKSRAFELRAAISLAQLLADQGEQKRALRTLKSVFGQFTEGFDAPDPKRAKAILDAL